QLSSLCLSAPPFCSFTVSSMLPPPPPSPLFPYTTLFRSPDLRRARRFLLPPRLGGTERLRRRHSRRLGEHPQTAHRTHRFEAGRSEEHTSELQSRFDLVCRLLLEKKKNKEAHRGRYRHTH